MSFGVGYHACHAILHYAPLVESSISMRSVHNESIIGTESFHPHTADANIKSQMLIPILVFPHPLPG